MARINRISFSPTFNSHHAVSVTEFGERNDCTVKSVAIACDVPYTVAHAACKKFGRRDGHGASLEIVKAAIRSLGFTIRQWSFQERMMVIAQYPGVHKGLQNVTSHHMRRFPKVWARKHSNMIMGNHNHIWAVKYGRCEDWSVNKSLRVDYIWEVEPV